MAKQPENVFKKSLNKLTMCQTRQPERCIKKSSKLIGLIIPDLNNPFYSQIVTSVENKLRPLKYQLIMIFDTGGDDARYKESVDTLIQNNIDGIISSAFEADLSAYTETPIVLFDSGHVNDSLTRIASDNYRGGELAAMALVSSGAKKIIIQHGPLSLPPIRERLEGILHYLNQSQVVYELQSVRDFTLVTAKEETPKLFKDFSDFDGVLAANDMYALEIMRKAQQAHLSVPGDLQIIGYDNSIFSQMSQPTITTIDQQADLIGKSAAETLLKKDQ
nr:substrate-binding domain-containing protein [Secundilactobacillus collinoides]